MSWWVLVPGVLLVVLGVLAAVVPPSTDVDNVAHKENTTKSHLVGTGYPQANARTM